MVSRYDLRATFWPAPEPSLRHALLGFGFLASDLALGGGLVLLGLALFLQITTVEDNADQLLDDADDTLDHAQDGVNGTAIVL